MYIIYCPSPKTARRTGHSSAVGKPKVLVMAVIWPSSESPANKGLRRNSSATMHPTYHHTHTFTLHQQKAMHPTYHHTYIHSSPIRSNG